MIHCSFVEVFFSPPSSGLLILGVEGSVIFEELDLRLHLTPMVSCLWRILKFRFKEKKIRKKWEKWGKEITPFSFYTWAISFLLYFKQVLSFPLKRAVQKVARFQILIHVNKGRVRVFDRINYQKVPQKKKGLCRDNEKAWFFTNRFIFCSCLVF